MKSVMLSIQPKWCELIARGEKTIEVRKSRPKIETPFKCYIYMSQGRFKDLGTYSEWIYQNRMRVIGEFVCDKVYSIKNRGSSFVVANEEQSVTNKIARQSCLDYYDMVSYLGNKDGYGLHITALKIYDKPKELGNFFTPMEKRPSYMIERPPQSWQYVEEL